MKIAYIVLAHKNVPQIRLLLEALQDENVSFYLHLDRLAGKNIYQESKTELAGINDLIFLKRFATNWGGFGLVRATIEAIHHICQNGEFDYVILLSGQDFPIKPKKQLVAFLEQNFGKSFMEYFQFPHPLWKDNGGYDRIDRWYLSLPLRKTWLSTKIRRGLNRLMNWLEPNRKFPEGFTPFGGAQWWCLHNECVQYIDEFVRTQRSFVRFFRNVRIPDEIFFQTILMNSPLANKIVNRKLTYVDWNTSPAPKVLDDSDLGKVFRSDDFFARKFDLLKNPQIFKDIDKLQVNKGLKTN